MNRRTFLLTAAATGLGRAAPAQNVLASASVGPTLDPIALADADAEAVAAIPEPRKRRPPTGRLAGKLARHVAELLDGWPWRPFHVTHGISGYEAYFAHPDELFHALALARPLLPDALGKRVAAFLAMRAKETPPYVETVPAARDGKPRERYDVPDAIRLQGPFPARSLLGVYALWHAAHACDLAVKQHWPAVVKRVGPLLAKDYAFDTKKAHRKDEAERLTGDLAGLIGFVRLARSGAVRDRAAERAGLVRLRQLLELRVNLDRVNPRVLEPTDATTAKLHAAKLARYCGLVPEAGAALATHTGGAAGKRLAAFRASRPGWWLAAGDRLIGGENYCSPPHLSRALFAGAALVGGAPAADLAGWVDVPWCAADLYFVEKAALALGRRSRTRSNS
jgi:hypothetical protein